MPNRYEMMQPEFPKTDPFEDDGSIGSVNWHLIDLARNYHDDKVDISIAKDRRVSPENQAQIERWQHSRWKSGYLGQAGHYVETAVNQLMAEGLRSENDTDGAKKLRAEAAAFVTEINRRVSTRKTIEEAPTTQKDIDRAKDLVSRATMLLHAHHPDLPDYSNYSTPEAA